MPADQPSTATQPQRSAGWQYSLRALLLLMLVIAVFSAWFGYHVRRTAQQRAAIAWLEARGAEVGYKVEHRTRWTFLGRWIPEPVKIVRLDGAASPLPIDDLEQLAALEELWILEIKNSQVTDLTPLAKLPKLQQLELPGAPVQDLSPLAGLNELSFLNLQGTQVHDPSPLQALAQLRYLDLKGAPIVDPTPLTELPRLKSLTLSTTHLPSLEPLHDLRVTCHLHLLGLTIQTSRSKTFSLCEKRGPARAL